MPSANLDQKRVSKARKSPAEGPVPKKPASSYSDRVIRGITATQIFLSDTRTCTLREDLTKDCSHLQKAAVGRVQLSGEEGKRGGCVSLHAGLWQGPKRFSRYMENSKGDSHL